MSPPARSPGFERLAPVYPLLERLVYGKRLRSGRLACLPELCNRQNLLLLGEGNGRFLRHLLEQNPSARVTVVEISQRMIASARRKLDANQRARVQWHCQSALDATFAADSFDAVVTHYFFDLFAPAEQTQILHHGLRALRSGGIWQDTEFLPAADTRLTDLRNRALLALSYRFLALFCDFPARTLHCPSVLFHGAGLLLAQERIHRGQIAARIWQKQ